MIPYTVIGTGSSGNGVIIGNRILVDAGLPFVKFEPYLNDLRLVLITHEHGDHFKPSTVRRMAHDKPLLRFGCGRWMVKKLVDAGVARSQIDILVDNMAQPYKTRKTKSGQQELMYTVIPVKVFHNVENFAYKIHFPEGKVFYATDMGNLTGIVARNYALYLVEANYKDEELKARMDAKIANGQYSYEQKVMKYHMSEKQCNDWLYANMGPNSEYVYLHQHIDREEPYESSDCKL